MDESLQALGTETAPRLGVMDLCKRSETRSARESLEDSAALARMAEDWGYHRYWVSEHHTADASQASPEVLITHLAAITTRIRIGSGGVLLRYYSPLKVAETFLAIEALAPGRIDLGVCKGPGVTSAATAEALVCGNTWELGDDAFDRKAHGLRGYLRHAAAAASNAQNPCARPWGVAPPPLWVLGSGSKSMRLAARLGVPYSFTLFFDPGQTYGPGLMAEYRERFLPSEGGAAPHSNIVVSALCLPKEGAAERRQAELTAGGQPPSNVMGTPRECADQLRALAAAYGVQEVLIATWQRDPDERAALYRGLAEECLEAR